jgi:hypothetical protein
MINRMIINRRIQLWPGAEFAKFVFGLDETMITRWARRARVLNAK